MSEMEQASALLGLVPEYKLGYVIGYLQGLIADEIAETPNAETVAAIQEVETMIRTGSHADLFGK